jgi:hypothetical protein
MAVIGNPEFREQMRHGAAGGYIAGRTGRFDDPLFAVPDESLDRVERVIAFSRMVLSVSALGVLLLDPREPMFSTGALYVVLVAYIFYSAWLLWLFTRRGMRARTASRPILLADVAWFTAIVGLSEGTSSPFFLFYLFAVCTAAIRWGIRTTLRVALLSGGTYLVGVLLVRRIVLGPDFSMHPRTSCGRSTSSCSAISSDSSASTSCRRNGDLSKWFPCSARWQVAVTPRW